MADHITTRKSTFTSASTSRKRRTHQPSVQDFGRRVDVYSKPEKYGLMAKQKQAEECVLYVRVSTTRQAEICLFAYRMDRLFRSTIDCLATVHFVDQDNLLSLQQLVECSSQS